MKRALAVAVLVLLAGCNVGGGQSTPTVSPAPVPAADQTPQRLAPGVTTEGVVDPSALAAAHDRHLRDRSYTLDANRTVRADGANGSLRSRVVLRAQFDRDRTYYARLQVAGPEAVRVLGDPPVEAAFWSNGSVYARAITDRNRTAYNTFEPATGAGTWRYWAHFSAFDERISYDPGLLFGIVGTEVVETRTVGGERRVVLDSAPVEDPTSRTASADTAFRDVRLRAVVTESGFVRSHHLTYTVSVDGQTRTVARTVQYSRVGETTVERPAWVERAVENGDG